MADIYTFGVVAIFAHEWHVLALKAFLVTVGVFLMVVITCQSRLGTDDIWSRKRQSPAVN